MLAYLRKPHADLAALILRIGLAYVFIGYGYIKLIQGHQMSEVMSYNLQLTVGWAELVCGILLVSGLLTRLAALGMIANMIGAIVLVTGKRGFFDPTVGPHGEKFQPGFEFNIIMILVCLALVVLGGGSISLDRLIFGRRRAETSAATPLPQAPVVAADPVKAGER
jgi:putative oxidoreductase